MSGPRMHNSSLRNYLTGQPNLFSTENETSRIEAHLQRDRYGSNVYSLPISPYNEVQGNNNGIRPDIRGETRDPEYSQVNPVTQEMDQAHEQDMEIGYEERTPQPPTYEGLEQRFIDEITKLARERSDAEDTEFARHKERLLEINTQYQEKLSALRSLQETRRDEFLRMELRARLNHHHESSNRNYCPSMKVPDNHGYASPPTFTAEEPNSRLHDANDYKHDGERTASLLSGRSQGSEAKVPLPPGRVYNKRALY